MELHRYGIACILAAIAAMACAGCANMSDPNRTRAEGTGVGAGIGAGIGALASNSKTGALIGAAVGAAAGYAIGDSVADKKKRYADAEDRLGKVIADADESTKQTHAANVKLASDLLALKRQQDLLSSRYASASAKQTALNSQKQKTQSLLAVNTQALSSLDKKLADERKRVNEQRQALADDDASSSRVALLRTAETSVNNLGNERDVLSASLEQLKAIDQRRAY